MLNFSDWVLDKNQPLELLHGQTHSMIASHLHCCTLLCDPFELHLTKHSFCLTCIHAFSPIIRIYRPNTQRCLFPAYQCVFYIRTQTTITPVSLRCRRQRLRRSTLLLPGWNLLSVTMACVYRAIFTRRLSTELLIAPISSLRLLGWV